MRVLVVNAGSSTVKLSVVDGDESVGDTTLEAPRAQLDPDALRPALDDLGPVDAVGHRVVHGGERFREPVAITPDVVETLHELAPLAPLHQEKSLAALGAVQQVLPETPAVACFDTAFHATLPPAASTYAIPLEWRERWGLRRFGFHGLSHAYIARRAPELAGAPVPRLVSAHLGAGASLCAIHDGHSVDTTMGFTPLEGLVMATRSGSVDPGLVLWLLDEAGLTQDEVAQTLEHESGLAALAGTADMRAIEEAAQRGDDRARLALDVYVHRLVAAVAAMAASLGGLDGLAFTGGVGEHSELVRQRACEGLAFLGVGTTAGVWVIPAREDLEIARGTRECLAS